MLLLHGFGDTPHTLRYLADDLFAHGYDVRAPLLPGHGRTLAVFDKTSHTEWLGAARAELMAMRAKYEWVALGGLSMGGALAAVLASEIRDIASLVLIAPYLGMPLYMRAALLLSPLWSEYVGPIASSADASVHDPVERANTQSYGHTTGRALRELWRLAREARRALPLITAPTLLIQSREDNRVSLRTAERAFVEIGAADKRIVLTRGAGHVITVDYGKERVFSEVRAWLGGGPGTAAPEPDVTNG